MEKNMKNKKINTEEIIYNLVLLLEDKDYKKKNPLPKFNMQEFYFIRDLIFRKPRGLLFFYLADHLMNNTIAYYLPMFNAPSMKKLQFLHNFISCEGNAKQAAIKAGYSPKTAKQQAYRILKEFQGFKRKK